MPLASACVRLLPLLLADVRVLLLAAACVRVLVLLLPPPPLAIRLRRCRLPTVALISSYVAAAPLMPSP